MKHLILLVLLALPLAAAWGQIQPGALLEVIQADSLVGTAQAEVESREFVGNVRMRQGNVNIACDRAVQHLTQHFVELIGNVVITQDTLTLKTDRGLYFNEQKYATTSTGIYLNDGTVTLTAQNGTYNTSTKIADFNTNVRVDEPAAKIKSDHLIYRRDSSLATATGNVAIRFKEENALVTGDTVFHYVDTKRSFFHANPILWQVDSTWSKKDSTSTTNDSLKLDTLSIKAHYMEARRDSTNSFLASGEVEIVRGAFSATAGDVQYLRSDSIVILQQRPTLWYEENQIRGDSVIVGMADNTIEWMQVYGAAFSISRSKENDADTTFPVNRFNQTTGKNMLFSFRDDKLNRIEVEGNAISVYFLFDQGRLNGVRRESGDRIIIDFENGKARYIRTLKGVEGAFYPEKYVTGVETSYNLEGFFWEEFAPQQPQMPAIFP